MARLAEGFVFGLALSCALAGRAWLLGIHLVDVGVAPTCRVRRAMAQRAMAGDAGTKASIKAMRAPASGPALRAFLFLASGRPPCVLCSAGFAPVEQEGVGR